MSEIVSVLRELWVVWLVLLFLGIVAWTFWPSRKEKLERHGRIPFESQD